jgi:betaine-homocysteine S-methyltransferase
LEPDREKTMTREGDVRRPGLLERLDDGPVICAQGYLFELERRGYLQAGPFVPEATLKRQNLEYARDL